ncbi:hypothetical protein OB962_10020 [Aeromonas piscicola]|uniref:DUF7939 domain-containing protein n=1 Tax=Aeromonas piscicola TaxID=600645 RepID=A0ABT7QC23_9GAMM|nr:hypothetical protein [Aeromonas piscicola]MDM5131333.1 hypothetical protein [Aeromonas piscicola]
MCWLPCWLLLCLLSTPALAAPPRAELLPGADSRDWLLIIEADGERQSNELAIAPLLRQFAVGKVTMSRVTTPVHSLTRWQIPLHTLDTGPGVVPSLSLGPEQTPALPLPERTLAAQPSQPISPIELQARVLHQGPLYPGQPFIYQLSLWLPANMETPNLTEPASDAFTIRRLGNDQWQAPAGAGLPGRLTRNWLLQAREPGLHPLVSPRFQGRLPQDNGTSDPLSARAATLFVKIDQAPQQPVASQLTLSQQLSPASGAREGEPVIRTLTLVMEGGDGNRLTLPRLTGPAALPAGMQARPDGEQQQERFLAKGALRFERQWRQALTATAPGDYLLPAITLPWFDTRSGRIEYARLPATPLRIEAGTPAQEAFTDPNHESLHWVIWALLLRALWQGWPRWHAFYRLQRALRREDANLARAALLAWASLRWLRHHAHLTGLPCRHAPALAAGLAALDRACFATQATPADRQRPWQGLVGPLCAYETFAIAYGLRQLARLGH